jgi:DNA-binding MarR family transcriptional regulator
MSEHDTIRWRERSLGYMVNVAARALEQALHRRIAPYGVVPGQFPALLALYHRDGRTQAELCVEVRIEQPTMARTLARMERDGLVERRPDQHDGRRALVFLTERARRLVPVLQAAADEENAIASRGTDRDAILQALAAIVANLDRPGQRMGKTTSQTGDVSPADSQSAK